MTDTHTHLYMPDVYPDGGVSAVERAIATGVTRMVLPGVDFASIPEILALHEKFPENTGAALGLHPTELGNDWQWQLDEMEKMLPGPYCAIGEVGMDLYHDSSRREEQREAFARQLNWARRYSLPVIIHCREGLDDTLAVIAAEQNSECTLPMPQLVFHSFTGTTEDVRKIRTVCDPMFGINGVVTFKNAPTLREALSEIRLDRILLETDSPWLSPAPKRGMTNESARIPYIRDCVASVLGVSPLEVETVTDASAASLFGFQ
ncbi:MAG: TatD family hydrolase [Candidatus Amulumruptor caecigallinarius]|nr:TatD family hydrolase [Candidatus Amulumruptor caecigallinarius]